MPVNPRKCRSVGVAASTGRSDPKAASPALLSPRGLEPRFLGALSQLLPGAGSSRPSTVGGPKCARRVSDRQRSNRARGPDGRTDNEAAQDPGEPGPESGGGWGRGGRSTGVQEGLPTGPGPIGAPRRVPGAGEPSGGQWARTARHAAARLGSLLGSGLAGPLRAPSLGVGWRGRRRPGPAYLVDPLEGHGGRGAAPGRGARGRLGRAGEAGARRRRAGGPGAGRREAGTEGRGATLGAGLSLPQRSAHPRQRRLYASRRVASLRAAAAAAAASASAQPHSAAAARAGGRAARSAERASGRAGGSLRGPRLSRAAPAGQTAGHGRCRWTEGRSLARSLSRSRGRAGGRRGRGGAGGARGGLRPCEGPVGIGGPGREAGGGGIRAAPAMSTRPPRG